MDEIVLIGGGGHCKSAIDVIEQENKFRIVGIVDKPELVGSDVLGYPIIAKDSDLGFLAEKYRYALVTTGQIKSPVLRRRLFDLAEKAGFFFPVVVSPRAYVSRYATVGKGTIVMHDAVIASNASVGVNCIINSKALLEHDSVIGNFCHIATASVVNGGVHIKDSSFIGSGSIIKQNVFIGPGSIISMGCHLRKDVNT